MQNKYPRRRESGHRGRLSVRTEVTCFVPWISAQPQSTAHPTSGGHPSDRCSPQAERSARWMATGSILVGTAVGSGIGEPAVIVDLFVIAVGLAESSLDQHTLRGFVIKVGVRFSDRRPAVHRNS